MTFEIKLEHLQATIDYSIYCYTTLKRSINDNICFYIQKFQFINYILNYVSMSKFGTHIFYKCNFKEVSIVRHLKDVFNLHLRIKDYDMSLRASFSRYEIFSNDKSYGEFYLGKRKFLKIINTSKTRQMFSVTSFGL